MKIVKVLFLSTIFFLSFCYKYLNGQEIKSFQYINPPPNSSYVSINSNIIIRQGSVINRASVNNNLIGAVGTKSGIHTGRVILADDSRTLVFTPTIPFQPDEEVTVTLNNGLMTASGSDAGKLVFKFHTCFNTNTFMPTSDLATYKTTKIVRKLSSATIPDSTLPWDLPAIIVDTSNNPSPGYFFIPASPYLEIVDNEGTPVFYRYVGGNVYDFDLQPNGELTYFIYPTSGYELDSSYNVVRTFGTTNGFAVNVHDLRVLPNGDYYIFGGRNVTMDMSQYGGDKNATVLDGALQEFDSTGNLIFQWDAINHYKITDVDDHIDLTQPTIDFTHFNSIAIDTDGNPIVSARNLDEITKIDHNTGKIIWRWGGKNNQFKFINDALGFSRQHDIRRFSNGDFSLFDNGVYHPTPMSSAVEYKLDEKNKTATLIYRIYHKNIYSVIEGSVQALPNGNRVISWGRNWNPVVSEVKTDGSTVIDLSYTHFIDNYRAFKYQWKTNLFTTNVDSINFGKIAWGNSTIKSFTVYNPRDTAVTINEFYCSTPSYTTNIKLPVIIQPKGSLVVPITFKPLKRGIFNVSFNVRNISKYFGESQMIAQQVMLKGRTISLINPITAPSNLIASSVGGDNIRLTWHDNSDNETGFVIERKQGDSLSTNTFSVMDTVAANDTIYYDKTIQDSVFYTYRVYAFNNDTLSNFSNLTTIEDITSVEKAPELPTQFILYQNYPNPFNPTTVIQYQIPYSSFVTLKVYDVLGNVVAVLVNEKKSPGIYSIDFNGMNLSNGIYFYQLNAGNYISVKKMVLLK